MKAGILTGAARSVWQCQEYIGEWDYLCLLSGADQLRLSQHLIEVISSTRVHGRIGRLSPSTF